MTKTKWLCARCGDEPQIYCGKYYCCGVEAISLSRWIGLQEDLLKAKRVDELETKVEELEEKIFRLKSGIVYLNGENDNA